MGNIHRLACTSAFQRALKEVVFQIVLSCFDGFLYFVNVRLLVDDLTNTICNSYGMMMKIFVP